jgi:hypothetical protein
MALPFLISPSNSDPLGEVVVNGFAGKDCKLFWSTGVYEIPNSKHQITNKSQIPISNDQNRFRIFNFGHCYLFVI